MIHEVGADIRFEVAGNGCRRDGDGLQEST